MPANPAMPLAREIWGNSFGQEFLFCWHIKQSWQVGNKGKEAEVHQGEKKLTFTVLKCQTFLVFLRKRGQKKVSVPGEGQYPECHLFPTWDYFTWYSFIFCWNLEKLCQRSPSWSLDFNEFNYIEDQPFEKRKSLFLEKKESWCDETRNVYPLGVWEF